MAVTRALFALLLLAVVGSVDSCVSGITPTTGCQCADGLSSSQCSAIWFSCQQKGTGSVTNIGLAFTYGQTQRTDPGYRWYIANGNGQASYPGDTGVYTPTIPFLPYRTGSIAGGASASNFPQWQTGGVTTLGSSSPVTQNNWACTADTLLTRSLNNGHGPTQPNCKYGSSPAAAVVPGSSCDAERLFDGFNTAEGTGWQLASIAVQTTAGVQEYPNLATRSAPVGLGKAVVPSNDGLKVGELRQIVSFSASDVNMDCYVSLFNPCTTCPSPVTVTTPGCCPSGAQLVNGACCPLGQVLQNPSGCCPAGTLATPTRTGCCPATGGPFVVCTGSSTAGCTLSGSTYCCPTNRYISSSGTCCPTGQLTATGPNGPMCCTAANIVAGQCCDGSAATGKTIVDGVCCPNAQAVTIGGTLRCCQSCNGGSCSGATPPLSGSAYTWLGGGQCCATALVSGTTCCPSCVASPTSAGTDLRVSGDCGRGSSACCPAAQVKTSTENTNTFCCPAPANALAWFTTTSNAVPYSSAWWVTPAGEGSSGSRCCPISNIKCKGMFDGVQTTAPSSGALAGYCCKDSNTFCTSTNYKCCPNAEWVKVASEDRCCGGTLQSRGCTGGNGAALGGCTFIEEGNCCPTAAVTTSPSGTPTCCFGNPNGPWSYAPACPACNGGQGTGQQSCCPTSRIVTASGVAVACCPANVAGGTYASPPTSSLSGSALDYCCPAARAVAGNAATNTAGKTFCCPASGGPFTIIGTSSGASLECCATNRVPTDPGTSNPRPDLDLCCPGTGYVVTYSGTTPQCCLSTRAVRDTSNVWRCCAFDSPNWVDGACCRASNTATSGGANDHCCPNANACGTGPCPVCTTVPPPTATGTCIVYSGAPLSGAPSGWNIQLSGQGTGYCCPSNYLTWNPATAASPTTVYTCCPATNRVWTQNDACCRADYIPEYDGINRGLATGRTLRAAGSKWCCPAAVITGTRYTQTNGVGPGASWNQDCCPVTYLNLDANTGSAVTTADARCCAAQNSYLVDEIAAGLNSGMQQCCPSANILPRLPSSGPHYCCPNALVGGEIWFNDANKGNTCCVGVNVITNPTVATEKVCCPATGYAWTDNAPGNSWAPAPDNCCPANRALPTTIAGLANSYCCPANTPNAPAGGIPGAVGYTGPAAPAWTIYRRIPTSAVANGSNWSSVTRQCCPPDNKQVNLIVDNTGAAVYVCCPAPNMTYIVGGSGSAGTFAPGCCPTETIRYVGAPGDLTKATCCPDNAPITAISQSNPSVSVCCPATKFNGIDTCCDAANAPASPTPTANNPCCALAERFDIGGFPWNRTGQYLCCPVQAGKPAPFVDPTTGTATTLPSCCYGYNTTNPPRACCPTATAFNALDDPCCVTVARPDSSCCPAGQWIPGANGQPKTGTCCPDGEVIVINGTSRTCCPQQFVDVTGTTCCDPTTGVVLDVQGNCCPADIINVDPITGEASCCGPDQRDDFGVCCSSIETIHLGGVDSNGNPNDTIRVCCNVNNTDCAGLCFWKDPLAGGVILVPYNTVDDNGVCCPADLGRDCLGLCPDPVTGLPINELLNGECCPNSTRDCQGICGGRDKNCCENPDTNADCDTCTEKTGCGWCSSPFSSAGSCFSGNHFGPYLGDSSLSPCDAGNRWVINPPSEVISKSGTFADGWKMQYKNYTVTLSPNDPLQVNFTVRVPANVPLDLYILQDGTASFGAQTNGEASSLQNFQSIFPNLVNAITVNVTSDLYLGFGLFADKPVEPFGFWSGSVFDYLWRNLAPLTSDISTVTAAVNALQNNDLRGGADIPEGTLEALVALGKRATEVGWRQPTATFSSNHIVLVVTDAPPHEASLPIVATSIPLYDLTWWTESGPDSANGIQNLVRPLSSWVANDASGLFPSAGCPRPSSATQQPTYAREGLCQDYPSMAQAITALQAQTIAPVFVVADTKGFNPQNVLYPDSAARDSWNRFVDQYAVAEGVPTFGLVAPLAGVGTAQGAAELERAILEAIYAVTSTIALRIISGSEWVTGVSPTEYANAVPGSDYTFTVELTWNGTWPGFEGPHPVEVLSLFPKTNFPIEPGHIDIYLAQPQYCGYCGDGIVQPEIGEECEPGVTGVVDLPCCSQECKLERNLCSGLARCSPSICDASGKCANEDVVCSAIVDPVQSLCSSNSCISGQCVVSCFGANDSLCCDDGDNCTRDTCVSGVCRHDFELPCDCGGNPAYNNCFSCIAVSNTSCGWDLATSTCVNINITDLLLYPEHYGIDPDNATVVVYERKTADKVCVADRSPSSKVGIIVGVIAGVAALAALIALAAVFGGRLKEIAERIFGNATASGSAANKTMDNPTYEVGIEQVNPLHN